jgi:hypothetical protein
MKDAAALSPAERALGYHNPTRGDYRLATLGALVEGVLEGSDSGVRSAVWRMQTANDRPDPIRRFDRPARAGLSWPT